MRIQLTVSMYGDLVPATLPLLRKWWEEIEEWARELRVEPNEISGGFKEKPKGLISHNAYGLARYRRRFARQIDKRNLEYLQLMCLRPKGGYRTSDWDYLGLYGVDPPVGASFIVGMDLQRLRDVGGNSPQILSQEAVRRSDPYLKAKYGFAVSMPKFFMPGGYAIGLASEVPEEMVYDCNAWSEFSGRECDRTLRNVYGYNILNAKHLGIPVGNQRLEDWIGASHVRGRIESLRDDLFLWTFQEGDDQEAFLNWDYPPVVRVREELKQYEIFPWQRFARQQHEPLR